MSERKADLERKKYFAQILFVQQEMEQKEIAQKLDISEKTISKWSQDGEWKQLRRRLLISKDTLINQLYEQIEKLNEDVKKKQGYATPAQADTLIKYTAAIKNLETDLSIAEIVDVGRKYMAFLKETSDLESVKQSAELYNSFIMSRLRS